MVAEPVPTGPRGAPLIVRPSWWPADASPLEGTLDALTRSGTPLVGGRVHIEGRELIEVTFCHRGKGPDGQGQDVMVHLNTLTDRHREDVRDALLVRVPGTAWSALTYLLAPDAIIGYRLVARDRIDPHVGALPGGWLGIHRDGRADPLCPEVLDEGEDRPASSVWTGPKAPIHPDWLRPDGGEGPDGAESPDDAEDPGGAEGPDDAGAFRVIVLDEDAAGRGARLLLGPAEGHGARRLLVLLDGEAWTRHGAARHLGRRAATWDVLLVGSGPPALRARDLPDPDRATALVQQRVQQAQQISGRSWDAADTVVAGQSFGGLAAASIAVLSPGTAAHAICQSGSFWHGSDGGPGEGEGTLIQHLRSHRQPSRPGEAFGGIVMQVGSEEGSMVQGTRTVAELLAERGQLVGLREFSGGHDYAWWRHGLSHALDALERTLGR